MTAVCIKLAPEVNRAFSAGGVRFHKSWGTAPGSRWNVRLWRWIPIDVSPKSVADRST